MNKTDLINQLAERMDGDRKAAQVAVEGFIDLIQREVVRGRNVSISGFGVFEKRARAARTARNPRTGEAVKVKKTNVPAFRPGKYFKDITSGALKLPKPSGQIVTARAAAAAARAAAAAPKATRSRGTAATKTAGTRTRATKSDAATAKSETAAPAATRTRAARTTAAAASTTGRRTRAVAGSAKTTASAKAAPAKPATTRRATAKAT